MKKMKKWKKWKNENFRMKLEYINGYRLNQSL